MNISIDFDQQQRAASYEAIEDIYLEGVTDGANGRLPKVFLGGGTPPKRNRAMSEIVYLQGYCKGMEESRADIGLLISVSAQQLQSELFEVEAEYPLLCGQCAHLINGRCGIKSVARNSSQYACEVVLVDTPF